ncbi:hypothetical protein Pelo_13920 [Pelomyxa schiedti]|nr:hypothetical protein Pelo_13920 [Pelomyxa schiedti]
MITPKQKKQGPQAETSKNERPPSREKPNPAESYGAAARFRYREDEPDDEIDSVSDGEYKPLQHRHSAVRDPDTSDDDATGSTTQKK